MIVPTTTLIKGRPVQEYLGILTGEAILGANVFKDFLAGIRDIIGGRSGAYENELRRAREIAIDEMTQQARERGATAVIAVDLDYESIELSGGGGMLMVTASGTAVRV